MLTDAHKVSKMCQTKYCWCVRCDKEWDENKLCKLQCALDYFAKSPDYKADRMQTMCNECLDKYKKERESQPADTKVDVAPEPTNTVATMGEQSHKTDLDKSEEKEGMEGESLSRANNHPTSERPGEQSWSIAKNLMEMCRHYHEGMRPRDY